MNTPDSKELSASYDLAKKVPDMRSHGLRIETNYGEIEIDADEGCAVIDLIEAILIRRVAALDASTACDVDSAKHLRPDSSNCHLNPNEIKHRLRQQGQTLKSFAEANGFKYRTVSDVVRGVRVGNFGEGRAVRQKLGLPVTD